MSENHILDAILKFRQKRMNGGVRHVIFLYFCRRFYPTLIHIEMRGLYCILLLLCSNVFMTVAWYGNLKLQQYPWFSKLSLPLIILLSWLLAGIEYCFMIPANRIGFVDNGGPFDLWQLKVIQEAISLTVFTIFTLLLFKTEPMRINHLIGFIFLLLAVYFLFKK